MKNHTRLLLFQCKYTKTPMSHFECFGHAVKGQCYTLTWNNNNNNINMWCACRLVPLRQQPTTSYVTNLNWHFLLGAF